VTNLFRTASISCGVIGLVALGLMMVQSRQPQPTEADIDDTLDASFPASDPPSWTSGIAQAGDATRKRSRRRR